MRMIPVLLELDPRAQSQTAWDKFVIGHTIVAAIPVRPHMFEARHRSFRFHVI